MDAAAKQQIVERLKQASNVLVTVSSSPSVDQLSACIGLTLMLNKMGKHATAVFSGEIPSTIEFLQPEKTIESNTDSLRDFIISLDKNKADKLRYKVEDQVVRIFITPYRTSLDEKDLEFSQGDFNIEAIVALGVKEQSQLDAAITAHGRILHDATVIAMEAGRGRPPVLGQLNWHEPTSSSLCEMIVSISEAFGTGLIDNQMATAFLTGIVAETQRFSNDKTSPKVMTMSAQLMAAGANQQLIISKLEPPPPEPSSEPPQAPEPPPKKPLPSPPKPPPAPKEPQTGILSVSHEPAGADSSEVEVDSGEIHIDEEGNITTTDEVAAQQPGLAPAMPKAPSEPVVQVPDKPIEVVENQQPQVQKKPEAHLQPPIAAQQPLAKKKDFGLELKSPVPPTDPELLALPVIKPPPQITDLHGSTLSELDATKPQATGDQPEVPGPHTLLNPTNYQPSISPPFTADTQPDWYDPESKTPIDPLSSAQRPNDALFSRGSGESSFYKPKTIDPPNVDTARGAVQSAFAAAPFDPSGHPLTGFGARSLSSELHTPAGPPAASAMPPPPPLPPPLTPAAGVVIPNLPPNPPKPT